MGKEQELIEAARSGNFVVVERILSQRAKKTGPLASLRRGPGANAQDQSGYTSLHHAALNGHKDIVSLLLQYEASTNVVDHKGSTPLHLAAWTGNTEIVRILLEQGPSVPNVNLANHDQETPLHSAAQYGHTEVVSLLLKHNSNPCIRNLKEESPLDLAAQYGRLETVELLISRHPHLIHDKVKKHSPLHLASRNGHKQVVKVLLDAGFDVNYLTSNGTSLHEAALYGKMEVVKLLLDGGVDTNLQDGQKRTIYDLLKDLNTNIARQTYKIIKGHVTPEDEGTEVSSNLSSPHGFLPSPYGSSGSYGTSPPRMTRSPLSEINHFDGPAHQYKLSVSSKRSSIGSGNEGLQTSPILLSKSLDNTLDKESTGSCTPSGSMNSPIQAPHAFRDVAVTSSDIINSLSPSTLTSGGRELTPSPPTRPSVTGSIYGTKPQPPAKPPRRSIAPISPVDKSLPTRLSGYGCELLLGDHGPNSGRLSPRPLSDHHESDNEAEPKKRKGSLDSKNGKITESSPFSALYDDIASGRVTSLSSSFFRYQNSPAVLSRGRQSISSCEDERPSKPNSLDFRSKRATVQIPLSPTHYQQPPTPDFPPPSPTTAAGGIHEKIRPLSQGDLRLAVYLDSQVNFLKEIDGTEYKRKRLSRDIETLTEEELFATVDPSGNVRVSLRKENKSVSTDTIEEIVEDDPFAGLCRGSICPQVCSLDSPRMDDVRHPTKRPMNLFQDGEFGSKLKTLSDGGGVGGADQRSSLSLLSPFDENAEWAEIADIMASFGSGIARESVFAREIEEQFTKTFISSDNRKKSGNARGFNNVKEWLASLEMDEYENLLMENGFDDVDFLGSTTLDDRDLIEIGVLAENHRQKILNSAKDFPNLLPIGRGEGKAGIPSSIEQWLRSLNLENYVASFRDNGYTDLDKFTNLTNEDLSRVLNIEKMGHRKRILASLGDRSWDSHFDDLEDLNLLKMNRNDTRQQSSSEEKPASDTKDHTVMEIDTKDLKIRPPTQLMGDPTTVGLRSPQQLFQDVPSLFAAQWRHQPEVLVRGSCNYTAQYLGSTLVKELKGMESTLRSIQKLKASTRDIGKVPNVILSISYSGVKFIDGRTKQLVCEHEIRNIHCACQDTDDLNHFAYITKEHQTTNHYCHVFRAHNTDVATEIILTLGQAFEVAYQLALKENSTKTATKFVHFINKSDDQKIEEKKKFVSHITVQLVQKSEKDGDSEDKQSL